MIGTTLIVIIALIACVWIFAEVQKLKHKIWAIFLIGLIVFTYVSFAVVLKDKNIDYTSPSGLIQAGGAYLSWLGSMFGNLRMMTSHAIKLDWSPSGDEIQNNAEEK